MFFFFYYSLISIACSVWNIFLKTIYRLLGTVPMKNFQAKFWQYIIESRMGKPLHKTFELFYITIIVSLFLALINKF